MVFSILAIIGIILIMIAFCLGVWFYVEADFNNMTWIIVFILSFYVAISILCITMNEIGYERGVRAVLKDQNNIERFVKYENSIPIDTIYYFNDIEYHD